jgi:hypothetical protein
MNLGRPWRAKCPTQFTTFFSFEPARQTAHHSLGFLS